MTKRAFFTFEHIQRLLSCGLNIFYCRYYCVYKNIKAHILQHIIWQYMFQYLWMMLPYFSFFTVTSISVFCLIKQLTFKTAKQSGKENQEDMDLSPDFIIDQLCDFEQALYPPDPKCPSIYRGMIVPTSKGGCEVYKINRYKKPHSGNSINITSLPLNLFSLFSLSPIQQVQLKAIYM